MKFEPQCKTRADLHEQWARVLRMCEGIEARPEDGWKYDGWCPKCTPKFDTAHPELHEFSIGIVEGKHVFRGDTLWHKELGKITADDKPPFGFMGLYDMDKLTWNPPKQEPIIPEGFTPWHGGEWIGHPKDWVEACLGSGKLIENEAQHLFIGFDYPFPERIIAYKITKKYQPETVMVELTIEDAREFTNHYQNLYPHIKRVEEAIRKALEKEKLL